MKTSKHKVLTLAMLLSFVQLGYSQAGGFSNGVLLSLVVFCLIVLIAIVLFIANNLIQIQAKKYGADLSTGSGFGFGKKTPAFTNGASFHNLKKGFNINLAGQPSNDSVSEFRTSRYAVKPTSFRGISPIPKVVVAVGDEVEAGDVLFFDKKRPEIKYVAPVSGEIIEINRGAKRAITEVVILADKENKYKSFDVPSLDVSREALVNFLCESGAWAYINQRPYDEVADTTVVPTNIFVSTFNTAPLALDNALALNGNETAFQKGLDVLAKLTDGQVHLGLDARGEQTAFAEASGVSKNYFAGKHPVGNVGVQIHHTAPITTKDQVWTLGVQDVITIGTLFTKGHYDATRYVSVGGAQIENPTIIKTEQGANVGELLQLTGLKEGNTRIIDGDVLSGKETSAEGYLGFTSDQITAIKEGDYYEMFGWLLPLKPRPSVSGTYPNALFKDYKFEGDTNTHGERRAFVVTGEYESVLPMDIYPQHLMKAILAGDIEKMEGLGINELSEEDLALCEFVCTSKMPLQSILRDGLDMMKEQS